MAARSIASLSLAFGLVSIPVKLYSATEPSAAIRFRWMAQDGSRLRQQYVSTRDAVEPATEVDVEAEAPAAPSGVRRTAPAAAAPAAATAARSRADGVGSDEPSGAWDDDEPAVVDRGRMVKGYEFEKDRFVLFTPAELEALAQASRHTIDIVAFIPEHSVDPLYYDKPYFLAPDKGGAKPYALLLQAMRETRRCALAKWAWRAKEYVVQIRSAERGLVLQQLRYADEVRSLDDLDIELVPVGKAELELAVRLIEQIAEDRYDPHRFVDEEKVRLRAAIERKIAGQAIVAPRAEAGPGGNVIDLMAALRASLADAPKVKGSAVVEAAAVKERKGARRAAPATAVAAPRRREKR
jgi:DNA end-binding protein Ku